jgi:hypothetical protein
MGLKVITTDETAPYPRPLRMVLMCDGHGDKLELFGGMRQEFTHADGFHGMYCDAMRAGWKDTHRGGERVILGPCCSGKLAGRQGVEPCWTDSESAA